MDLNNRGIRTVDDVMNLLDGLFAPDADRWTRGGADWWDRFYADRDRPGVPGGPTELSSLPSRRLAVLPRIVL